MATLVFVCTAEICSSKICFIFKSSNFFIDECKKKKRKL